jgi:hypothetical protein
MLIIWLRIKNKIKGFFKKEQNITRVYIYEENDQE